MTEVRRTLLVALVDTVALDNSVARNRTLTAIAMAGLEASETGELEERVEALEATLKHREPPTPHLRDGGSMSQLKTRLEHLAPSLSAKQRFLFIVGQPGPGRRWSPTRAG